MYGPTVEYWDAARPPSLTGGYMLGRLAAHAVALIRARFVHGDVEPALGEFLSGGESGDAGTQHHDSPAPLACRGGCDGFGHDGPDRRAGQQAGRRRCPDCGMDVGEQGVVRTLHVVERAANGYGACFHGFAKSDLCVDHVEDGGSGCGDPGVSPIRFTVGDLEPVAAAQREELAVNVDFDDHRPEPVENQAIAVGHLVRQVLDRPPQQRRNLFSHRGTRIHRCRRSSMRSPLIEPFARAVPFVSQSTVDRSRRTSLG